MKIVIWWIRRDLRLSDNPALRMALQTGLPVLPLFIVDPAIEKEPTHPVQSFLWQGLHELDQSLREHGSFLLIRQGSPLQVLKILVNSLELETIFAEEDYTPYAQKRDALIQSQLPLKLVSGLTVHHPSLISKADGSPYTVFTPFSKAWKLLPMFCSAKAWALPAKFLTPPLLDGIDLPKSKTNPHFPAGEAEARKRLDNFSRSGIFCYAQYRDRMDMDGTSTLSPYFHMGMLSICQAVRTVEAARRDVSGTNEANSVETWLNELIWREFYNAILYHFPYVRNQAFDPKYRHIPWCNTPENLRAWQLGLTGFPVIDAAMRQLAQIGWMHNRARMIVASFLTKDLLLNWQDGEEWFLRNLVDADIASNNGGWQWTAGVGTDAAPYFRIFNPTLQSAKFDPQGNYIRKWLPELANVPDEFIHQPMLMNSVQQNAAHCYLGTDYSLPIVDRSLAHERTLAAYKISKQIYQSNQVKTDLQFT